MISSHPKLIEGNHSATLGLNSYDLFILNLRRKSQKIISRFNDDRVCFPNIIQILLHGTVR
jgi:hypothetical protein